MIPKIIHYCWFGGKELGEVEKNYIDGWKKVLSDYLIIEWNEKNFDISSSCEYVRQAYEKKKWAFVSDYARLNALYYYGGIYLDTDVEVLKSFDDLLKTKAFIGAESDYSVCTAIIGAEKKSEFLKDALGLYDSKKFILDSGEIDTTPNSQLIFNMLVAKYGYKPSSRAFDCDECRIYPADYFSPINCYTLKTLVTDNTYSIHHYAGTWKSGGEKFKDKLVSLATRIIGEKNREKIKRTIKGKK